MASPRTSRTRPGFSLLIASCIGVSLAPAAVAQTIVAVNEPVARPCLACLATREGTDAEWTGALAATANVKASAGDAALRTATRSDANLDPRSSIERMRDEADRAYGDELARLSAVATRIDAAAQAYLATCYERSLPVGASGFAPSPNLPGSLARRVPPPPTDAGRLTSRVSPEPLRAVVNAGSGPGFFVWDESWLSGGPLNGESLVLCEGTWRDVSRGGQAVKAALDLIELDARANDIYPGVIRELFEFYSLAASR